MKKYSFVAIMAIVVVAFTACDKKGGNNANIKSSADSVSYAMGVLNSQYVQNMGIDSTDMKMFMKGLKDGMKNAGDEKKEAYNKGLMMGIQMGGSYKEIAKKYELLGTGTMSEDLFLAGIASAFAKDQKMNPMQAQMLVQGAVDKIIKANQKQSEKFIADKAKENGVKKLAGGTLYKVIKAGNGKKATDGDMVKIHYEGKGIDGEVFDSSYKRGEPAEMAIGQTIPGFTEALKNMPVGSTWEIYIPWNQAYGEQGSGNKILPYSALIFKIELIEANKAPQQPQMMPMPKGEEAADSTAKAKK
jgi:FKBP-type peptidyl-prolyl cis-trans isomerase FklB